MKTILFFLFFVLISSHVNATEQIPELLHLDWSPFQIEETPLEMHPDYEKIFNKYILTGEFCTASWRGYQGVWVIQEKKLWLRYLYRKPCSEFPEKIPLYTAFNQNSNDIFADWYTGKITFRISEITYFKEDTQGRIPGYEYEAVIYRIKNGNVTARSVEKIKVKHSLDN